MEEEFIEDIPIDKLTDDDWQNINEYYSSEIYDEDDQIITNLIA